MSSRDQLLKNLYGDHFNREIGTPHRKACYHLNVLLHKLEHHESQGHPFYCTVYDYKPGNQIPLKPPARGYTYNYSENVILDKIFFDFDKDYNPRAREELNNRVTTSRKREFILELMEAGRLEDPINQAKNTARYITKHYGGEPLLVFSGSKGCHLYIFFEPVQLDHPKECLKYLTMELEKKGLFKINNDKEKGGLLDRAPIGDVSRLSRAPSSIHPETGLYCHPFKVNTPYLEIISNSQKPEPPFIDVEPENMRSSLDKVFLEIDEVIKNRMEVQRLQRLLGKLEPKRPSRAGKYKQVKIEEPRDVLLLNRWPCFSNSPYDHDLRLIIATICLWSDLSPEETGEALTIYSRDRGLNEDKHLHQPARVERDLLKDGRPKYSFTCSSMKDRGLCRDCKDWFYLKLDLGEEYKNLLDTYKKGEGVEDI